MEKAEMFNTDDLERACDDLSLLPYFPVDGRAAIMRLLAAMCPHKPALLWLVSETINHVRQWPGPAELRGLLCTRYDAADGVDAWCSLPGYTADDAETQHFDKHKQLTSAGGWESDALNDLRQLPAPPSSPANPKGIS